MIASAALWLFTTKRGLQTLAVLAVLALAFAYRHKLINFGRGIGREEQRTEQVQGIRTGLDLDRRETKQRDGTIARRIGSADQQAALARARAEGYRAAEKELAEKQKQAPETEGKLTICEERVVKLKDAAEEDHKETKALVDKTLALADQVLNQKAYTARLESRFVELWNANPPKKRSWRCLKAWKCGEDRLKPPPLDEISAEAVVSPRN